MDSSLPQKPIITVNEARKLLGSSLKYLTDNEIKHLIQDYETLATQAVREYLVRK